MVKANRKTGVRFLVTIFVLSLVLSLMPISVFAEETDSSYVTKGEYQYTSNENSNKQSQDKFTFREDCFRRSSHLGCCHLVELSAQVAISSASWYGPKEDMYEVDQSDAGHNLVNMLKAMGFQNVSCNQYYSEGNLTDSASCAIGMMKFSNMGKDYTLLAVIPRSAGYKQEWVGNFTVDDGDVHQGFKDARDEILRFTKKYIKDNNISGDLKIWTAGHSRGAALANMLGGFFAGGDISYLGDDIMLTPEDVYCYTFATPRTIKDGASKNDVFSVSGARSGRYEKDTPGDAWAYTAGGTIDPDADEYKGVRNFPLPYDLITILPPPGWGFRYFGSTLSCDADGCATVDDMLNALKDINPYAYDYFVNRGDFRKFSPKTFDLPSLSIIDDPDGKIDSMADLENQRLEGLIRLAQTNKQYAEDGYQDMLKAVAGLYGMLLPSFNGGISIQIGDHLKALIFSLLSYSKERLIEEGKAENENDAVALALSDLITTLTGESIDANTATIDDFFAVLTKYLADHENDAVSKSAISGIAGIIPEDYKETITIVFEGFCVNVDEDNPPSLEEVLKAFIKACAFGADPESSVGQDEAFHDPKYVRRSFYDILGFVASSPDIPEFIKRIEDGSGPVKGFISSVLEYFMTETDEEGTVIKKFESVDEAADAFVIQSVDKLLKETAEATKDIYGEQYYNDVSGHLNYVKSDIKTLRRLVTYGLFYNKGEEYNTASMIKNGTTFLGNAIIIPISHYNEVYIAWARAVRNSDCTDCKHYIEFKEGTEATCQKEGSKAVWILHDEGVERYFTDRNLSEEINAGDVPIDKLAHEPGKAVRENIVEPDGDKDGHYDEVVYCRVCGEELSRKRVVIPAEKTTEETTEETTEKTTEETKPTDEESTEERSSKEKTSVTTKADTSKKATSKQSKTSPKTGDNENAGVWMILLLSALMMLSVIMITRRKKQN